MPVEPAKSAITRDPILVDLALQGGGSHGAFTWGVLDRLLEEPWLGIDGISGTSAGAMNAAVLVDGHAKGGAAGARMALENFWRRVSEAARFSPFRRGPLDVLLGRWTLDSSPIYVTIDLMSRLLSPYDLNPMGNNPLRAILAEAIDFARLAQAPIKIFITATNVRSGRGHVLPTGGAGCVASSPLMRPLRPLRLCPCMFFLCVCVLEPQGRECYRKRSSGRRR
jgi:NTE family protein